MRTICFAEKMFNWYVILWWATFNHSKIIRRHELFEKHSTESKFTEIISLACCSDSSNSFKIVWISCANDSILTVYVFFFQQKIIPFLFLFFFEYLFRSFSEFSLFTESKLNESFFGQMKTKFKQWPFLTSHNERWLLQASSVALLSWPVKMEYNEIQNSNRSAWSWFTCDSCFGFRCQWIKYVIFSKVESMKFLQNCVVLS